jgi:hypothetical protein
MFMARQVRLFIGSRTAPEQPSTLAGSKAMITWLVVVEHLAFARVHTRIAFDTEASRISRRALARKVRFFSGS